MATRSAKDDFLSALFGKTRRAVLSLLYGRAGEALYLRQIARAAGVGLGPAQRELKQLTDAGIVLRSVQGRRVYYRANARSPIFQELKSLVGRSSSPPSALSPSSADAGAYRIAIPRRKLASFCRRHHIRRLSLFGSVLPEDLRPDSDVDVLVEFEPGHTPGFAIVSIEEELAQIIGRKVDLRTPTDLSPDFRGAVLREARELYVVAQG
ncbi:MAG: nucleotidyltransferase domain-containing protein [Chloroflexi bacterium]|nr:nucleotidyltransferase domain-containing protein [Chloroflexota bacterium]